MTWGDRFRVNTPDVTHEVIDDEAVIINLETGHYYSLQLVGAEIWTLVAATASIGAIVDHLTQGYACERSEVESIVSSLIAQLREERLIVPLEAGHPATLPRPISSVRPQRPLQVPRLQKFTDMQELLLLDPIHEVDDRGWPHRKVEQPLTGAGGASTQDRRHDSAP
jgi:hypothetical protein